MKKLHILGFLLCLLAMLCTTVLAVPAPNRPQKITQPDGSVITLILHGDEHYSWVTTVDGYSVMKNAKGFFEYVGVIEDGKAVLSGVCASDPEVRKNKEKRFLKKISPNLKPQREFSTEQSFGSVPKGQNANGMEWQIRPHGFASKPDFKGICVPVNFSDYPLRTSAETIDSLMNMPGYKSYGLPGSVRDYYHDMSRGKFEFKIDVLPAYTARRGREDYGESADNLKTEIVQYVLDVLGEKTAEYDRDKDGYIDHISIIFAGQGQELNAGQTGLIWSHNSITDWYGYNYKNISISCIAEIDNFENHPGIETYCHEFGHVLGLPDHYDVNYDNWGQAEHPDVQDLMSANTATGKPVPLSAFSRYALGWTQFKTLSAATPGTYQLRDMLQENYALRYNTATQGEFFVLENRTPLCKWQAYPEQGNGLLIFRVDSAYYKQNLARNQVNAHADHLGYQLMRADNNSSWNTEKGDFFPYGGKYTSFTDNTTPSAKSLAGVNTNLPLTGITQSNNIISFQFAASGNSLLVVGGDVRPDSAWGHYSMAGSVIRTEGQDCKEKGVCYSLLPNPTVNGSKVVATGEENDFVAKLDLTSFAVGAVINLRAYATDNAGNTVYGAKRQITLPKPVTKVNSRYIARKKDNDYTEKMFGKYTGIALDLSDMREPMLELHSPENILGCEEENADRLRSVLTGNILVSSDGGRNYHEVEPTYYRKQTLSQYKSDHIYRYPLPDLSSCYRILLPLSIPDSIIISEGKAYQITPTPLTIVHHPAITGNVYSEFGINQQYNQGEDTILTFNTSQMDRPVLYLRNPDANYAPLVKTSSEEYFRLRDLDEYCNNLEFRHYTEPATDESNGRYSERFLFYDNTFALPVDTLVYVLVRGCIEMEVFDMGGQQIALRRLQALDNKTVEIEGRRILDPEYLPITDNEYGICWNTEPTPSLQNRKALGGMEDGFVCPLTDLPEETLYFYAYNKKGDKVDFSADYLKSEFAAGKRANILPFDTLNPITPIEKTAQAYTVRVRYSPEEIAQAGAQGICYKYPQGKTLPVINDLSQYSEGTATSTNYYTLTAKDGDTYNWYSLCLRPFVMDNSGNIEYGYSTRIEACAITADKTYLSGKILHAPCDLISDAATKNGHAYWKKPAGSSLYSSSNSSTQYLQFRHSTLSSSDTIRLLSPMIEQKSMRAPVLFLRVSIGSSTRPKYFSVYAVNARNGEKTLLSQVELIDYSSSSTNIQPIEISTKAGGDSIYLSFEFPYMVDINITEMKIEEKLTPSVFSGTLTEENNLVSMSGRVENRDMFPVTASGFVYSIYGDPVRDGDMAYFADSVHVQADENGNMQASFRQEELAYVYARAFATNENGTSFGDLMGELKVCGFHTVSATRLPASDILCGTGYRVNGESFNLSSCERSVSGILKLTQRPQRKKIAVSGTITIHLPMYEQAYQQPESILAPMVSLLYRNVGTQEWMDCSDLKLTFVSKGMLVLGSDLGAVTFNFEATASRNMEQVKVAVSNSYWESMFKFDEYESGKYKILYSESTQDDLDASVPTLEYVTVQNNKNTLYWNIPDWNNVSRMVIYREGNTAGSLEALQEITPNSGTARSGSFTDQTSLPSTKAYTYVVKSFNSEGLDFSSTPHKTMHLTINKGIQNQWNLMWNFYEGREVSSVSVYRGNSEGTLTFIDEIAGTNNTYTDVNAPEGDVYYVVEVKFDDAKNTKATPISRSNIATNVTQATTYTVSIQQTTGGNVSVTYNGQPISSGTVLEQGSVLRLTATPNNGYLFEKWMDGSTVNPRDLTLSGNLQVSATFKKNGVGIEETAADNIQVYPNPMDDRLHIVSPYGIHVAELYNLQGLVVWKKQNFIQTELNTKNLPAGVYLLRCQTDHGLVTVKTVKR